MKEMIIQRMLEQEGHLTQLIEAADLEANKSRVHFLHARVISDAHGTERTRNPVPLTIKLLEWLAEEVRIHREKIMTGWVTRFAASSIDKEYAVRPNSEQIRESEGGFSRPDEGQEGHSDRDLGLLFDRVDTRYIGESMREG